MSKPRCKLLKPSPGSDEDNDLENQATKEENEPLLVVAPDERSAHGKVSCKFLEYDMEDVIVQYSTLFV